MKLERKAKTASRVVVPVHEHHMARKFVEYCRRTGYSGTLRNLPGEWVVFRVEVPKAEQEAFIEGWEKHYAT
jgi:hypothetical protein